MLKQQMQYGAVHAKVMALYGKMLKDDDWRKLCECKNVSEICALLRNHKGWNETMTELPPSPAPKLLEIAVRKRLFVEYEKLYKFLPSEDRAFLRFFSYRAEYDYILDALSERSSESQLPKTLELTDFIRKNSSVNIDELEHSKNFTATLNAVKNSIFFKPLSELKINPDTGKPSYWEASIALENKFYKEFYSYLSSKYKGLGKKKLEETIGLEADLINITSIIRLQRSFRSYLERSDGLLIPISHHLKPDFIQSLINAKSETEAIEMLRKSTFGKHFEGIETEKIDSLFYSCMEKFCRKLIRAADTGLSAPQAYLILKEQECRRLNRVIEAVSIGVDPKSVI